MKSLLTTVQEYLNIRRSLGYKLKTTERMLYDFINFLTSRKTNLITVAHTIEWATQSKDAPAMSRAQRLSVVRLFAEFRKIADPRTEIPPKHLLPYKPKRAMPHIYSTEQIAQMLKAFLSLQSHQI